jgi:hypothetical protein
MSKKQSNGKRRANPERSGPDAETRALKWLRSLLHQEAASTT